MDWDKRITEGYEAAKQHGVLVQAQEHGMFFWKLSDFDEKEAPVVTPITIHTHTKPVSYDVVVIQGEICRDNHVYKEGELILSVSGFDLSFLQTGSPPYQKMQVPERPPVERSLSNQELKEMLAATPLLKTKIQKI